MEVAGTRDPEDPADLHTVTPLALCGEDRPCVLIHIELRQCSFYALERC